MYLFFFSFTNLSSTKQNQACEEFLKNFYNRTINWNNEVSSLPNSVWLKLSPWSWSTWNGKVKGVNTGKTFYKVIQHSQAGRIRPPITVHCIEWEKRRQTKTKKAWPVWKPGGNERCQHGKKVLTKVIQLSPPGEEI